MFEVENAGTRKSADGTAAAIKGKGSEEERRGRQKGIERKEPDYVAVRTDGRKQTDKEGN